MLFLLGAFGTASADIAVVAHPGIPVRQWSEKHILNLYLGRTRHLESEVGAGSVTVKVFEYSGDSAIKARFYRTLTGMNLSQVNAYWARLRFSGEVLPPQALPDTQSVLAEVRRTPGSIGYVDSAAVTEGVRVVLKLKESSE